MVKMLKDGGLMLEIALAEYGLSNEEDRFMRVMWCESRGDPDAVNAESGASGLMQHIPRYWDERARRCWLPRSVSI